MPQNHPHGPPGRRTPDPTALKDADPATLTPAEFVRSRQRKNRESTLLLPVIGFGPEGKHTLFLASPTPKVGYIFQNGKPVRKVSETVMGDRRIRELRDAVIAGMSVAGPGLLDVPASFLEYVAAVITISYDVSDADLTFLLSGTKYQQPMIHHMLGGSDVMASLRAFAPRLTPIAPPPPPAPIAQPRAPMPPTPPAAPALSSPLFRFFCRPRPRRK